jgi:hypothetical protein
MTVNVARAPSTVRGFRGDSLDLTVLAVNDQLPELQPVLVNRRVAEHAMQAAHHVLGLVHGHRREQNPRRRVRYRNRHPIRVDTAEPARSAQLKVAGSTPVVRFENG